MTITFNELRKIKDNLPAGSMQEIANRLSVDVDTVRNYFGGTHYKTGDCVGIHVEQGPDGGIVALDNTAILDMAKTILEEQNILH
jgi:hypothetical protein